jgi:hypothetical protein
MCTKKKRKIKQTKNKQKKEQEKNQTKGGRNVH